MRTKSRNVYTVLFLSGAALRFLLYLFNPPGNSFDNHFEPILYIINNLGIPPKIWCWECNQPSFFYIVSAITGAAAMGLGAQGTVFYKLLQSLPCLYGIATLPVIYLILKNIPLTPFARVASFGIACFLPRHIYMSAIHTNDTFACFFVSLCVYFLIVAIKNDFARVAVIDLAVMVLLTIFTKYTSLIVLPAVICAFALSLYQQSIAHRPLVEKKSLLNLVVICIPLVLLSASMGLNYHRYGNPLPTNLDLLKGPVQKGYIPGEKVRFLDFRPCQVINTPLLVPGISHSFWTLIHGGMWFDMEPKFLYFTDPAPTWWTQYYEYLKGIKSVFPLPLPLSTQTRATGSALIAMGLVPMLLFFAGMLFLTAKRQALWKSTANQGTIIVTILAVLCIANAAGIIIHTVKFPFFTHMKATFFLNSLPSFTVFVAAGIMATEKYRVVKWCMTLFFSALFAIVTVHIVQIVLALSHADVSMFLLR